MLGFFHITVITKNDNKMVTDWDFINGRITKKVVKTAPDGSKKTILVMQKGIIMCGNANKISTHLAQLVCNSIYPKKR